VTALQAANASLSEALVTAREDLAGGVAEQQLVQVSRAGLPWGGGGGQAAPAAAQVPLDLASATERSVPCACCLLSRHLPCMWPV
jgi:hypothetical protein